VKDSQALERLEALPGDDEDLLLKGGSAVIGPDYRYVTEPLWEEPSIVYAELDLDCITEGHMLLDTDGHYSRPDVFRLEVNDKPQLNVTFTSHRG
jgi:nitrilase